MKTAGCALCIVDRIDKTGETASIAAKYCQHPRIEMVACTCGCRRYYCKNHFAQHVLRAALGI